jgi:hypothetical protein
MGKTTKGHGDKGSSKSDEDVPGVETSTKESLFKLFKQASLLESKVAVYDFLLEVLKPYVEEDSFLELPKGTLVKVVPREAMIDVKRELANARVDLYTELQKIMGK